MNREQMIRLLRRYARQQNITFSILKGKGKGSHYIVLVGTERTTLQNDLDTYEMLRALKQLKIDPKCL